MTPGRGATHGVQQVERAQAVLGAREAPAHHGGAWAGGRLGGRNVLGWAGKVAAGS